MIDLGKKNILGIEINAIDYEAATEKIIQAAKGQKKFAVSALAVHGVMTGILDKIHASRLNSLELVVPDGQPVRWALNTLFDCKLPDRCYGPNLTLKVCEEAAQEKLPVYFYGSRTNVVRNLVRNVKSKYQSLVVAGYRSSLFRKTTVAEKKAVINEIKKSGARIVFVGLGCPRQEIWAYEYRDDLRMPIIAVGAAFDFHSGLTKQAPSFMQNYGMEWLFRLLSDPKRLWKRYLLLNPYFLFLLGLQYTKLYMFKPNKYKDNIDHEMHG